MGGRMAEAIYGLRALTPQSLRFPESLGGQVFEPEEAAVLLYSPFNGETLQRWVLPAGSPGKPWRLVFDDACNAMYLLHKEHPPMVMVWQTEIDGPGHWIRPRLMPIAHDDTEACA